MDEYKPILIDNFDTGYKISNTGIVINMNSDPVSIWIGNHGYSSVTLRYHGYQTNKLVHRLVAQAFIPNPENKPAVNHIDGNKQNNHVSNLEWVTYKENMEHAVKHGLNGACIGSSSPFAIHSEDQIRLACKLLSEKTLSYDEISKISGVSYRTIESIMHRGKWKSISQDYDITPYSGRKCWSEEENRQIRILHDVGMTNSDIIKEMKLPKNNSSKLHVSKIIRKLNLQRSDADYDEIILS